jgi:hypothetical protein
MKRLTYCVVALLLIGGSGLCFGQAIGEMMQVQPRVSPPAPSMPGNSNGFSGRSRVRRNIPSTSGGVINMGKTHYQLPAKTTSTGQPQPAFKVYGDDADDDSTNAQPAPSPKPQITAPAKVGNAPPPAAKDSSTSGPPS